MRQEELLFEEEPVAGAALELKTCLLVLWTTDSAPDDRKGVWGSCKVRMVGSGLNQGCSTSALLGFSMRTVRRGQAPRWPVS